MGVTRRRRLLDVVIGHPSTRRMALTHGIDDFADALITLSLLGSLFFSVSLEASRTRILAYLLLTAAPLAIVAPALGPLLDRSRAGYRITMISSHVARAVLSLCLAGSLLSLAFYPFVFGILLSRKAYALAKTAIVAQLVPDREALVQTSGHLARTGTIAGGLGTAAGGSLIALIGVDWLPVVAAVVYLAAAVVGATVPVHAPEFRPAAVVVRAEIPPDVRVAAGAVAVIRASTGALTFLLAFAIKRGGGDEWIFAAALVAAGIGAFGGTLLAPQLHRLLPSNRVIAFTLLVPGAVCTVGVAAVGNLPIIAIAFAIGLAGSVSSRAMDALYGTVPHLVRGRAISQSELVFQLANVTGAAAAVLVAPSPRVGFAAVGALMVVGALLYASRVRLSLRRATGSLLLGRPDVDESDDLVTALLGEAAHHAETGNLRLAIAIADTAVRSMGRLPDDLPAACDWATMRPAIEAAICDGGSASPELAVAVIATARRMESAANEVASATAPPAESPVSAPVVEAQPSL